MLFTNHGSIAHGEDHYAMTLNITRLRVSRGQRHSKRRDLFNRLSEALLVNDGISHSANLHFNI
jgi:hypothetical protein